MRMRTMRIGLGGSALWALGLLAGLACSGCFRELRETITSDSGALIVFEGAGGPVTLLIDGAVIAEEVYLTPSDGVRYRVPKGRHEVEVRKGDRKLLWREVYVADGETRVVRVPKD